MSRLGSTDGPYAASTAGEQERLIVKALADLRDMDVREVMTPRMDVVALNIPVHEQDVARAVRESGHSAFPVVHDDLDHLVGILYVTDLFRSRRQGRGSGPPGSGGSGGSGASGADTRGGAAGRSPAPAVGVSPPPSPLEISRRLRQPCVLPESRRLLDALAEMRRHRRGFAVVVDEYGGVSGVLTVKDLLEPLVGELHDEFDAPDDEPAVVRVDSSRWLVDGRASVDDVRDRLAVDLPDGDYVTIGGYLFDGFGHIPVEGEILSVEGWDLRVVEMDKRRIVKVLVHRRSPEDGPGAGASGARSTPAPRDFGPERARGIAGQDQGKA